MTTFAGSEHERAETIVAWCGAAAEYRRLAGLPARHTGRRGASTRALLETAAQAERMAGAVAGAVAGGIAQLTDPLET
jgi:hypothetical protein